MKGDVENIVNDVRIYSEGLILAIQREKFDEAKLWIMHQK